MPVILLFSGAEVPNAHGFFITTVILSLVMIPVFWLCGLGCKETYADQLHSDAFTSEKLGFIGSVKEICKNDQLLMVVLATILGTICVSGRIGLLTYYIIYVVGDYTVIASVFTTMTVVLLAAAGYVAGAEQTDSAKAGINAVVNLVPLVIGLLSLVPLIFYKLNPAKVAEIHADLDAGKHQGDK